MAAGQAFAHTGVRDVATAGAASYNGFTITHGCGGDSGDAYPVIGQSAIFPFGDNVVWRDAAGVAYAHGGGGAVFDTIVLDHTGVPLPDEGLNLQVTGYSGASSGFATTQEIVDDLGNVQAMLWKDGAMEPKLNSITPFKVTIPKIVDSCVKQVKVRIGVINYCDTGKNAANDAAGPWIAPKDAFGRAIPAISLLATSGGIQANVNVSPVYTTLRAGNGDNNRADWWFTALDGGSALYNDVDLLQPTYWTTMTVNNPTFDAAACGAGKVVSVEPTGAAFDTYLTSKNTAPFSKGLSNL
jgi:hypothetical protein